MPEISETWTTGPSEANRFALASFVDASGAARAGVVRGAELIDLVWALDTEAHRNEQRDIGALTVWNTVPEELERLLSVPDWVSRCEAATDLLDEAPPELRFAISSVRWLPPVRRPEKILALALNYVTHTQEANKPAPEFPSIFGKYANSLCGALDAVTIPAASHRIDYEGELAVIIGRRAHRIEPGEAASVIAGYSVANDVSARDYQARTPQLTQGKIFDGFCPLGPVLQRIPDVADLAGLRLTTHVNDEQRQSAVLGDMLFDVPFVVSYLSQILTLQPGDVILTGTPGGIGGALNPRRWLRNGDLATIAIEGVGKISNRFVAAAS